MSDDEHGSLERVTSTASEAASAAQSAQSVASAAQTGGVEGALAGATSATSLGQSASSLASSVPGAGSAMGDVNRATSTASQAAGTAQQVAGLATSAASAIPSSGPASPSASAAPAPSPAPTDDAAAYSSLGPSDSGEALANAMSALVGGVEGDGVSLRFEAEPSVHSVWTASSAAMTETLSSGYAAHVRLVTHDVSADPSELLGASVTLTWARGSLARKLHGIVDEVTTGDGAPGDSESTSASVRVVPALALLGLGKNTRIFQDQSVPEIVQAVLDAGLGPFGRTAKVQAEQEYPKREYCTQYDESDLAFVERLCAEVGLFSFFDHAGSVEELRVVDDASKYPALVSTSGARLPYSSLAGTAGHEAIGSFHRHDRMRPTKLALRHADFTEPANFVKGEVPEAQSDPDAPSDDPIGASRGPAREVYEHDSRPITFSAYDSGNKKFGANDSAAQRLLRRAHATQEAVTFVGDGTATGLSAGTVFTLSGHPQALDGSYVVVSVQHSLHVGDAAQSHGAAASLGASYANHFTCVLSTVAFRPVQRHDKPRVRGVLTATVTGLDNEEIHTDEYGRIKVQFHFDREGEFDDTSSCFLRVVQPWAGDGWGFVFLPRIGMEAVVTFVDGDPDRPIVTGTVYNGATPLPETLPDTKTKSIIRTRTSPGGEGFNELSFEDAKDHQKVFLQAEKDLTENVKNAHSTTVGGAQSISVGGNRSVSVKKDETYTVEGKRTTEVKGGEDKLTITSKWTVDATSEIAIQAPDKITLTCGGSSITMEPGKIVIKSGGNSWLALDGNADLTASGGGQVYLTGDAYMKSSASSHVHLTGDADLRSSKSGQVYLTGDALMQSAGGATVKLTANADMKGAQASVSGQSKATMSAAGGSVEAAPAGVTVAGPKIDVSGGMVNIAGAMVKVN